MNEKNSGASTLKKKRVIYSILLAVCVLLLVAATALTVYFVTSAGHEVIENNPPAGGGPTDDTPAGGNPSEKPDEKPDDKPDEGDDKKPDDDKPTGGEDVVKFAAPLTDATCFTEYASVYTNVTLNNQIRKHMGVDYAAAEGTAVLAVASGTVKSVSLDATLGNVVTVDHGDGIMSYYRFVEPKENLKAGDTVRKGEEIATIAAAYGTEQHDGAHLHFEMWLNADRVNPSDYFDIVYREK